MLQPVITVVSPVTQAIFSGTQVHSVVDVGDGGAIGKPSASEPVQAIPGVRNQQGGQPGASRRDGPWQSVSVVGIGNRPALGGKADAPQQGGGRISKREAAICGREIVKRQGLAARP